MISIRNIFHTNQTESPLIIPHHALPDITVSTKNQRQARVYPRQRLSRIPPDRHERHTKVITIRSISNSNSKESSLCTHEYDHSTTKKIQNTLRQGGVVFASNDTQQILCRGSECLPSRVCKWGALFENCFPLQKSYFKKI